jgi:lauroyl/myristoyl acyltransferase
MPPCSLGVRVRTSPWLRRTLPTRPLVARAERRGRASWEHDARAREKARATIEAIVAGTPRAGELEQLARLHVIEASVDRTLFWQPWSARIDARSAARLREALTGERGVILSACHLGAFYRSMYALPVRRGQQYSVVGPWFLQQPSHDYWGRRVARMRRGALGRPVLSKGSFPILLALLARGESMYLFYDRPGRRETPFLGKTATLADGSARLAVEADALVLALRARRTGHEVWVDVAAALDPRELSDVGQMHNALAAVHERWILEEPAAMADPDSFGWEHGATARAWVRT